MKVSDLKKIAPLESVAELDPSKQYLVRLPGQTPLNAAHLIHEQLKQAGVNCLLLLGDDIKVFHLGEIKSL